MSDPYVKLFSGVNYPILTANDMAKGMWRGVYEGVRGRPAKTVIAHMGSQVIGSSVGRMADTGDDLTGIAMVQGNNMIVQSAVTGIVSGGIDTAMNRGRMAERFLVPVAVDVGVDWAAQYLYSGNPRIL